jgi:AraC-like DNA-binding protein
MRLASQVRIVRRKQYAVARGRRDLAVRYLDDRKLHVSKIAWLLGFHELSVFTHAFKRWTGKTPSQLRTAGAH